MFVGSVNPATGNWTGAQPPANQIGWKAVGVPGTFAGLFMAQTNYGRKLDGTNYFLFAEILKPALARIANGQATGNAYYTLTSVSNLLMDLYTNSPGYLDSNGQPNPNSLNDPYAVFYAGDIALDLVAAMQANGGLVTYADMTNYRPREVIGLPARPPGCRQGSPPVALRCGLRNLLQLRHLRGGHRLLHSAFCPRALLAAPCPDGVTTVTPPRGPGVYPMLIGRSSMFTGLAQLLRRVSGGNASLIRSKATFCTRQTSVRFCTWPASCLLVVLRNRLTNTRLGC
jgi:hypothetical protein